jgi:hypothetical protein
VSDLLDLNQERFQRRDYRGEFGRRSPMQYFQYGLGAGGKRQLNEIGAIHLHAGLGIIWGQGA